jgi:prevent-host-death family protein
MVTTLRESKAKLSELVERASKGEDILITVRGKVKAKLTQAPQQKKLDMKAWAEEL